MILYVETSLLLVVLLLAQLCHAQEYQIGVHQLTNLPATEIGTSEHDVEQQSVYLSADGTRTSRPNINRRLRHIFNAHSARRNVNIIMIDLHEKQASDKKDRLSTEPIIIDDKTTHYKRLFWAATSGNIPALKKILASGVPVDVTNEHGETALMWAVKENQLASVNYLLEQNAKTSLTNDNGDFALLIAAANQGPDMVKALLDHGADVNQQTIEEKRTALMLASNHDALEDVKVLLQHGAAIDYTDLEGRSALEYWRMGNRLTEVGNVLKDFSDNQPRQSWAHRAWKKLT